MRILLCSSLILLFHLGIKGQDIVFSKKMENAEFYIYPDEYKITPKKHKKINSIEKLLAHYQKMINLKEQDFLYWKSEKYRKYRTRYLNALNAPRFEELASGGSFYIQPMHYFAFELDKIPTIVIKYKIFLNNSFNNNFGLTLQKRGDRWYINSVSKDIGRFMKFIEKTDSERLLELLTCEKKIGKEKLNYTIFKICERKSINFSILLKAISGRLGVKERKYLDYFYEKS